MRLHLTNARLIDGTGGPAQEAAALVIENDTIVHAGRLAAADRPPASEATIVDLGGRTVLPGLVEAHIHLSYNNVRAIADLDLNCPPDTPRSSPRGTPSWPCTAATRPRARPAPCTRSTWRSSGRSTRGSIPARACWPPAATSAPRAAWPTGTRRT